MYVSFMKEVSQEFRSKYNEKIIKDLSFSNIGFSKDVLYFIKENGLEEYKQIFDTIGIKYDEIHSNGLSYTVNGVDLTLDDLSSGERLLLYTSIKTSQNEPVIILGLLDRLDYKHLRSLEKLFSSCNKLIALTFQRSPYTDDFIEKYYKPFKEIETELSL